MEPGYPQLARIGKAVSMPQWLELLDLLSHGEQSVERLAEQADLSIKNPSAHLRVLREARLVEPRKEGMYVYYPARRGHNQVRAGAPRPARGR